MTCRIRGSGVPETVTTSVFSGQRLDCTTPLRGIKHGLLIVLFYCAVFGFVSCLLFGNGELLEQDAPVP